VCSSAVNFQASRLPSPVASIVRHPFTAKQSTADRINAPGEALSASSSGRSHARSRFRMPSLRTPNAAPLVNYRIFRLINRLPDF